ncbi:MULTISPECIES: hypothetical protein [unclassified Pseudomonas]|uniref:hypothetical protein n=1 Tax=unclassified Pseudomonas TaxID=196821 RepID=UPI0010226D75|nr:hypothetical protein [Pseudomonas sp. SWI36]
MEPKELDKPDQAFADSAAGQTAQPGRSYAGILVHHGAAPYQNDPAKQGSYYVTLQTPAGPQTLWGAGLEQAMRETAPAVGKPVQLDYQGGAEAGSEQSTQGRWSVHSIDTAALQAHNSGQQTNARPSPGAAPDIDPSVFDAIMKVAGEVKPKGPSLDPDEVRRINAALLDNASNAAEPPKPAEPAEQEPQHPRDTNGAESLLRGGAQLVGGVASLTGAAMQGIGKGASALASALRGDGQVQDAQVPSAQSATAEKHSAAVEPGSAEEMTGRVQVLPRLSEYRVDQVEKAATNYEKAHSAFWNAGSLPQVREQIETRAEQTGLSVPEVIEKMKPDGEYTDLHESFVQAVGESPDAQNSKKAMDKALTGWARQYGRAQEELLNPETQDNPHYDKLKNRLESSSESMHRNAGSMPAFAGETQSHLERLREVMQRIGERLKEMVQGIVSLVRGKPSGPSQGDDFTP